MEIFFPQHLHFWFLLKCGLSDNFGFAFLQDNTQLQLGGSCPLLMEPVLLPQFPPLPAVSDPTLLYPFTCLDVVCI